MYVLVDFSKAEVECLEKIGATLLKNDEQDDEGVDLFSTSEADGILLVANRSSRTQGRQLQDPSFETG